MIARSARMDFPFRVRVEGFRVRTMTRYAMVTWLKSFILR
jgi:hypothetical protein